ncbi:MAG: alpha/beta hydrolase family protein [Sciscionella sp.]
MTSANPREVLTRDAEPPAMVLRYDDHADALIDVFVPPALETLPVAHPLVVLLHGGFWRSEFDRHHLRPLANALASAGCTVAVPEFRRSGAGGQWPIIGADVEAALAAVRALLADSAPAYVDATAPYLLVGHSSGGHLAIWAGLRATPSTVRRIVALAPISDLTECARLRLDHSAAQELLGGEPADVPEAYADADPLRLLHGGVPVTVIHGAADDRVPVSMSRSLAAAHPEVDYIELPGVEHFALIDPRTDAFAAAVLPSCQPPRAS